MRSRDFLLKWIIAFKALKASSLAGLGIWLVATRHNDPADMLVRAARKLNLPVTSTLLQRALSLVANLTLQRRMALAATAFAFAVLMGTEGVGLHYRKPWARWLTIIATGSLIPFEVYECAHRPSVLRFLILLINILVVVYLVRRKEIFERE